MGAGRPGLGRGPALRLHLGNGETSPNGRSLRLRSCFEGLADLVLLVTLGRGHHPYPSCCTRAETEAQKGLEFAHSRTAQKCQLEPARVTTTPCFGGCLFPADPYPLAPGPRRGRELRGGQGLS